MKNGIETMMSALNLFEGVCGVKQKVSSIFQLPGLVINEYSFKNSGLSFNCECSTITTLVRETNKILTGLKQHGSSIMFFKSLNSDFHFCWGTEMDSPKFIKRRLSSNRQKITVVII